MVRYKTQVWLEDSLISDHELWMTWRMMNYRCYSEVHDSYPKYGGSGISVCLDWRWDNVHGFINFLRDVGTRPDGMTLDREDPYAGYSKDNCRWATKRTQQNNFRKEKQTISGHIGVVLCQDTGRWKAFSTLFEKAVCINFYDDINEAITAREKVQEIKMAEGDQAASDYINSLKITTPKGKRFYNGKTSKYYGVSLHSETGMWRAAVHERINGKLKQIGLGRFYKEEDAHFAVTNYLKKKEEDAEQKWLVL